MSACSACSIALRSESIHARAAATAVWHSSSMASIGAGAAPPGMVRVARAATGSRACETSTSSGRPTISARGGFEGVAVERGGVPHDAVRGAVVEAGLEADRLGDVGRHRAALAQRALGSLRVDGQALGDRGGEPEQPCREVDRAGDLAVREEQVVGAAGGCPLRGEHAGGAADQRAGAAAQDDERVRVALLRHQGAGSAQLVADPHQAELVAAVDLDVLGEAAGSDRRDRGVGGEVGEPVGLPVGVAGVVDEPAEAQQLGEPLAVEREP